MNAQRDARVSGLASLLQLSPSSRAEIHEQEPAPSTDAGRSDIWALAIVIGACALLVVGAISGATWPFVGAVLGAALGGFVAGFVA
jgi:hypothetical protein